MKWFKQTNISESAQDILMLLLMLALFSFLMVISILAGTSANPQRDYISLTEGMEGSIVSVETIKPGELRSPARYFATTLAAGRDLYRTQLLNSQTDFYHAEDKNTRWSTETDIEIFRVRYDGNGNGRVTVSSEDGDKVFAPGTGNTYQFSLHNTADRSLDYTLRMEAYYIGTDDLYIPIHVKVAGDDGYLLGSSAVWMDPIKLNTVKESGVIAAGNVKNYTLVWEWPFERGTGDALKANDAYDTMLGNLAVDKDLELHIKIYTQASMDEDPNAQGGSPYVKTGDENHPVLWTVVMLVTALAFIFILVQKRKLDRIEEEQAV